LSSCLPFSNLQKTMPNFFDPEALGVRTAGTKSAGENEVVGPSKNGKRAGDHGKKKISQTGGCPKEGGSPSGWFWKRAWWGVIFAQKKRNLKEARVVRPESQWCGPEERKDLGTHVAGGVCGKQKKNGPHRPNRIMQG